MHLLLPHQYIERSEVARLYCVQLNHIVDAGRILLRASPPEIRVKRTLTLPGMLLMLLMIGSSV